MSDARVPWTPIEAFQLATFVANDTEPQGGVCSAVFLHGHAPDNELSVLNMGYELYVAEKALKIVINAVNEGGPYQPPGYPDRPIAYSGGNHWSKWLVQGGVPLDDILRISQPSVSHTVTEAEEFVSLALQNKWKDVYVVAAPFHLPRAFISEVSQLTRQYPELRVWCKSGTPLPWSEGGATSQGHIGGTRFDDFMKIEWDRITKIYNNKHDLLPPAAVFEYIRRRGG